MNNENEQQPDLPGEVDDENENEILLTRRQRQLRLDIDADSRFSFSEISDLITTALHTTAVRGALEEELRLAGVYTAELLNISITEMDDVSSPSHPTDDDYSTNVTSLAPGMLIFIAEGGDVPPGWYVVAKFDHDGSRESNTGWQWHCFRLVDGLRQTIQEEDLHLHTNIADAPDYLSEELLDKLRSFIAIHIK